MNKNYSTYTAAEFLEDPFFIEWVKDNRDSASVFWNEWIRTVPPNLDQMREAELQLRAIFSAEKIAVQETVAAGVWKKIENHISNEGRALTVIRRRSVAQKFLKPMLSVAAVFIVFILAGYFIALHFRKEGRMMKEPHTANREQIIIRPGGNRASLILANGDVVVLDSAQNGTLGMQGTTRIIKLNNGALAYDNGKEKQEALLYNTITTPRGGQYQVTLADGTKVWLNALSSLRFPTAFSDGERKVEVAGEAYFEVVHNSSSPFKVVANGIETVDLGTRFNINTYKDDAADRITLLEGAVQVIKGGASRVLKPGQQAQVSNDIRIVNNVDLEEVIAWKNGKFVFNKDTDIETIMQQIARWYDVQVEYRGTIRQRFWGSISKEADLSQVLKILEATGGVRFQLNGNKIIIMPAKT
ncbi:hypothetical protein A8C56_19350 [Niabella ginsenosidivorans]|uniref:Iron dicitrate transport regulator FecR n=1 Tax=Niabella ginsenosidivorans TaxID=1176587 RepID=A0A1A9I5L6_9BACT|nr:FecR family protein [Niabella ginsenosidivorans]ANH82853.1 hypothetical protein A8C56_19350 [Niabella ginsenosidivorans]